MLEGGGITPILLPKDLEDMGFKLVAYPLSLLGVSIGAMESALISLKSGRIPQMPSFTHIQEVVGFPEYYEEQDKYKADRKPRHQTTESIDSDGFSSSEPDVILPDEVVEPQQSASKDTSPSGYENNDAGSAQSPDPNASNSDHGSKKTGTAAKNIRLCIKDIKTNATILDSRFPIAFVNRIANFIPEGTDLNIEDLIKSAMKSDWNPTEPILRFPCEDTIIELYLE